MIGARLQQVMARRVRRPRPRPWSSTSHDERETWRWFGEMQRSLSGVGINGGKSESATTRRRQVPAGAKFNKSSTPIGTQRRAGLRPVQGPTAAGWLQRSISIGRALDPAFQIVWGSRDGLGERDWPRAASGSQAFDAASPMPTRRPVSSSHNASWNERRLCARVTIVTRWKSAFSSWQRCRL